jgi:tetratricopeptide (TPR) repeat protein
MSPASGIFEGRTKERPLLCREQVLALVLALAALAGAFLLVQRIEVPPARQPETVAPIFFPRVEIRRPALLGFDGLAADFTWIRTIQYFGGRLERAEKFPQLYQLVDMTTSLDPHFLDAYVYGGLLLVIAKQFPQAIAIYEKGIAANPDAWQLPHDLGRLYFLELRDYEKALHWWQVTDGLPGRPNYIPRFLIRLQAKVGHLATALELWQRMYETTDNPWVRKTAKTEIEKILAEMKARHSETKSPEGAR